jgi:hypothetical protein
MAVFQTSMDVSEAHGAPGPQATKVARWYAACVRLSWRSAGSGHEEELIAWASCDRRRSGRGRSDLMPGDGGGGAAPSPGRGWPGSRVGDLQELVTVIAVTPVLVLHLAVFAFMSSR